MQSFQQKLALITGSASGIGRALAIALAREGANLFLTDLNPARLADVADEARLLGVRVSTHIADLARTSDVEYLVDSLLDRWNGLDILINNAGIAFYGLTEQMTDQQCERLLAVNLHAPILLTRRLLRHLLARPEAHIVNVCSIAGLVAAPRLSAYHVSKFGLVGFSESLRAEYGRRGLGVTALCPGLVRTNIFDAADTSPGKSVPRLPSWFYSSPERVARRALRAIRRDEGIALVTTLDYVTWGLKRFAPGLLDFAQRFRRRRPSSASADPLVESPANDTYLDHSEYDLDDAESLDQHIIPFEVAAGRRIAA